MPTRFPPAPFRIEGTTPACDRVAILEALAWDAAADPDVRAMAARAAASAGPGATAARRAGAALALVQDLPLRDDPAGAEVFQPAAVTLARGGDCEDLVVVLVGALRALGLGAEVVWITQPSHNLNHVSARVALPDAWAWADPSVRGARLGESPYAAAARYGSPAGDRPGARGAAALRSGAGA